MSREDQKFSDVLLRQIQPHSREYTENKYSDIWVESRVPCNMDNCSTTKAGLCTRAWGNTELKLLKVRFRYCQHSYTLQLTKKVYMSHWFLLPKGELHGQTPFSPALTYFYFFWMHLASVAKTWPLRATRAYATDSRPHSHLDSIPSSACNSLKKVRLLPPSIWILNRYIRTRGKAEFLR